MSRTSSLRKQHDSLLILSDDITSAAAELLSDGRNAQPLQRLLRQFDTVLTTHLMSEDRLLYPELAASGDRRTAATARRFCEEMGGLASVYAKFAARWRSAEELLADPAGFARDWSTLRGALTFRIQRENAEIYPLADAPWEPPARKAG